MKKILIQAVISSLSLACGAQLEAQSSSTQAANWLQIPSSAQAASLAGGLSALGQGSAASEASPAGMGGQGWEAEASHQLMFGGMSLQSASVATHNSQGSSWGLGLEYLNFGDVKIYSVDSQGLPSEAGSINPYGMALKASYARELAGMRLGASVKGIQQSLGQAQASTLAADLGLRAKLGHGFSLGASINQLGGSLDSISLDSRARLGAAYAFSGSQGLALGVDAVYALGQNTPSLVAGATGSLGLFKLRGAYQYGQAGAASGPTLGLSLPLGQLELSYAYQGIGELGATHVMGLSWHGAALPKAQGAVQTVEMP